MNWYRKANEDLAIKLYDGVIDSHDGQLDCQLVAYPPGQTSDAWPPPIVYGYIAYSIYEEFIHIQHIKVKDEFQRRGIATKMMDYLKSQHPGIPIDTGMMTPDGSHFFESFDLKEKARQSSEAYGQYGV